MATWRLSLVRSRNRGFSIIEVITAVAILGIGIWAIVALFPKGQNIIRRSGLRQLATQLAHEAISDYLAEPAKLPYAIVPFDPNQIPNRPVLLEPAHILDVRRTYNFVWGEPLDDGRPQGDPNKRVGLTPVDTDGDGQPNEWRAILKFAPVMDANGDNQVDANDIRVYREVRYEKSNPDDDGDGRVDEDPEDGIDNEGDGRVDEDPARDFIFYFDPTQDQTVYITPTNRPRVLRVTYVPKVAGSVPLVERELYLVSGGVNNFTLNAAASDVLEVIEEYPIAPTNFSSFGVLTFLDSTLSPSGVPSDRLGYLRVDYFIDNPVSSDGHWIVETGTTFAAQGGSVFQTTLGGLQNVQVVNLMPPPAWGNSVNPDLTNSNFQNGLIFFPNLPAGTRLRVAYRVEGDWFVQVIKPPNDFQLMPSGLSPQAQDALNQFPFERLRWFSTTFQFSPLLAGLNVTVRYRNNMGVQFEEVRSIGANGQVNLSQSPNRIDGVFGSSLLIRISGQSMWTQSPPRTKADFVELVTIVPPVQLSQP